MYPPKNLIPELVEYLIDDPLVAQYVARCPASVQRALSADRMQNIWRQNGKHHAVELRGLWREALRQVFDGGRVRSDVERQRLLEVTAAERRAHALGLVERIPGKQLYYLEARAFLGVRWNHRRMARLVPPDIRQGKPLWLIGDLRAMKARLDAGEFRDEDARNHGSEGPLSEAQEAARSAEKTRERIARQAEYERCLRDE